MVAEIELFKILKTRFTDSEAESIVASIEQKVHSSFEERKNDFSTKDDISKLEIRLLEKIAETNQRITETKAEVIKWMFIFWIGGVSLELGLVIAFAKCLVH